MAKPRKAAVVAAALEAKGMTLDASGHHLMFRKTIDGVVTLVTRISHSASEIPDGLGVMMGKQCALQLKEFWELVDCTLSEQDWDAKIKQRCPNGRNTMLGGGR